MTLPTNSVYVYHVLIEDFLPVMTQAYSYDIPSLQSALLLHDEQPETKPDIPAHNGIRRFHDRSFLRQRTSMS